VLLINQYSKFQDKLVILYPTVEILRKNSFHEVVCARLFLTVDNQLHRAEDSLIRSRDIECSWSSPGWIWHLFRLAWRRRIEHKIFELNTWREEKL